MNKMYSNTILLLLTSLLMVLTFTWMLITFLRLKKPVMNYKSNEIYMTACNLSKSYVYTSFKVCIGMLFLSICMVFYSSYVVYSNYSTK